MEFIFLILEKKIMDSNEVHIKILLCKYVSTVPFCVKNYFTSCYFTVFLMRERYTTDEAVYTK